MTDDYSPEPEKVNEIPPLKEVSTVLSGKTFSAAGFSEKEETEISKSVEANGGKYLFNFSSELDYLIKADSETEPIKVKKANLLVKKGRLSSSDNKLSGVFSCPKTCKDSHISHLMKHKIDYA